MPKYQSLADLKAAYESGELTEDNPLTLDNDSSYAYADNQQMYQGGGPSDLICEALDLLGIPWENC